MTRKVPHIDLNPDPRTGEPRPRFNPSPALRKLGHTRKNLQHEDGTWFTPGEALDFVRSLTAGVKRDRKAARSTAKKLGIKAPAAGLMTVQRLLNEFQNPAINPRFTVDGEQRGKMQRAGLAENTIRDYRQKARVIETGAPEIWALPVAALDSAIVTAMFEDLWSQRGLASARGAIAVLSAAISWGIKRGRVPGLSANPCRDLGISVPPPRVRAGTPQEIMALIAAADELGLPEIGDMITLAVWTGQRQGDRRALEDAGLVDGRRVFRQSKTGKIVAIKESPELAARLAAAKKRRQAAKILSTRLILDESRWVPFTERHYNRKLEAVKAVAARSVPSVADLRDQDFRDTAVTWLARAGVDIPGICAITGHQLASATRILRHYIDMTGDMADTAIDRMVAWYDGRAA